MSVLLAHIPYFERNPIGVAVPAVILHPVCALLTIALFIIHVYVGTAFECGAFGSVLRGDLSPAWADEHRHAWYERVVRDSLPRK